MEVSLEVSVRDSYSPGRHRAEKRAFKKASNRKCPLDIHFVTWLGLAREMGEGIGGQTEVPW